MLHKIGDMVRIKQLEGNSKFSGELGCINGFRDDYFIIQLFGKLLIAENAITLAESEFINISQLNQSQATKSLKEPSSNTKETAVTFYIPDNLSEGTFSGLEHGLEYTLTIKKVK